MVTEWIFSHLIQLAICLLALISNLVLLIAGVFSCPIENSFSSWFQNIVDYMADSETKESKSYWDRARNYGFNFFVNKTLTNSMKLHLLDFVE